MALAFANCSTSYAEGTRKIRLEVDMVWDADDPFVKAHPELFSATPIKVHRTVAVVEQATAAPGEKRSTRRGD
jgi:hypothetical protein